MANINVSGTLNSVVVDQTANTPVVAKAAQVYDDTIGKTQAQINQDMSPVTFTVSGETLIIS